MCGDQARNARGTVGVDGERPAPNGRSGSWLIPSYGRRGMRLSITSLCLDTRRPIPKMIGREPPDSVVAVLSRQSDAVPPARCHRSSSGSWTTSSGDEEIPAQPGPCILWRLCVPPSSFHPSAPFSRRCSARTWGESLSGSWNACDPRVLPLPTPSRSSSMTEAKFGHYSCLGATVDQHQTACPRAESNFVSHPLIPWRRAKLPTLAESFASYFCC